MTNPSSIQYIVKSLSQIFQHVASTYHNHFKSSIITLCHNYNQTLGNVTTLVKDKVTKKVQKQMVDTAMNNISKNMNKNTYHNQCMKSLPNSVHDPVVTTFDSTVSLFDDKDDAQFKSTNNKKDEYHTLKVSAMNTLIHYRNEDKEMKQMETKNSVHTLEKQLTQHPSKKGDIMKQELYQIPNNSQLQTNDMESSKDQSMEPQVNVLPINKELDVNIKNKEVSTENALDQHPTIKYQLPNSNQNVISIGKPIPSTQLSRLYNFASLGIRLVASTTVDYVKNRTNNNTNINNKTTTNNPKKPDNSFNSISSHLRSSFLTTANAQLLTSHLCHLRGAALKVGQMLSMDTELLPHILQEAFQTVRNHAESMPPYQLKYVLELELGLKWRERFVEFDEHPFAAASIGQCHRAVINTGKDNDNNTRQVVVKVQYPGVSQSIASDLNNLQKVFTYTNIIPSGMFLEEILRVAHEELGKECHYTLEQKNQERFHKLFKKDATLINNKFHVPNLIPKLSTDKLITMDYCPGLPINQARNYVHQYECNRLGSMILYLTLKELLLWRFMQTDPNWSNYLYDPDTNMTYCIDFGACREFSPEFVGNYHSLIQASVNQDEAKLLTISHKMGFLSGKENPILLQAHVKSGLILGEPFQENVYDFGNSDINVRIGNELHVFLQHRVKEPPEEVYTLHRKLAGCYQLCRKMGAKVKCRDVLQQVEDDYFKERMCHTS